MDNNKLANPAPLGLMGFGMTTVLLNIHNAGFEGIVCGLSAIYLAMAEVLNEAKGREVLLIGEVQKV
jgi:succinate-acetate transporter protein